MQNQDSSSLILWFLPLYFVVVWALICYAISFVSGWHTLARAFRTDSPPSDKLRTAGPFFYTVYMMRWSRYTGVIRITATADGIYLSAALLLRIGHPPLFVPWEQIEISHAQKWGQQLVVLTLGKEQRVAVRISKKMAAKLDIPNA